LSQLTGSRVYYGLVRHEGDRISQKKQKQIEECCGWLKTIALLRKLRHRGLFKVEWAFTFAWRPAILLVA
jgi:hypothetical protein